MWLVKRLKMHTQTKSINLWRIWNFHRDRSLLLLRFVTGLFGVIVSWYLLLFHFFLLATPPTFLALLRASVTGSRPGPGARLPAPVSRPATAAGTGTTFSRARTGPASWCGYEYDQAWERTAPPDFHGPSGARRTLQDLKSFACHGPLAQAEPFSGK